METGSEIREVKRGEVVLPTGVRLSFFGWEIDLGLSDSWYRSVSILLGRDFLLVVMESDEGEIVDYICEDLEDIRELMEDLDVPAPLSELKEWLNTRAR